LVRGNVFVRVPYYVINVHRGKNNVIENNVMVDAARGPGVALNDYRTPELLRANTVRRNIFVNVNQPIHIPYHKGRTTQMFQRPTRLPRSGSKSV